MTLDIYVNYRGTCEEAFRFYEQHLGGRITGMLHHGEQPNPNIPADWHDKVVHARILIGSTVLMGADILGAEPMRSAYVTLSVDDEGQAERIYGLLKDGGQVFMKMAKTPFANWSRHPPFMVRSHPQSRGSATRRASGPLPKR